MRWRADVAAVAGISLALLLAPRAFLSPLLSALREPAVPPAEVAVSPVEAAYPESLFVAAREGRVAAPVFAYGVGPFRHDLGLALGEDAGIVEGSVAVLPDGRAQPVLVGRVTEASRTSASVETLSSPEWQTAVRVGASSVDALLVGGLTPTLTLIPRGAPVAPGDPVVSADPSLPYGLILGTVAEVHDAPDGVLREATLATPYALSGLRAVDVIPGNAL